MKIEIRERSVKVPTKLRAHVEHMLDLALGKFDARIARVSVRFSNGPAETGRLHKQCVIEVVVRPERSVRVEDSDTDPFVAVDRASERIAKALARALARERELGSKT
jgi:ribosomal subunit interface protein